jgi:hypothetical protein
MVDDIDRAEARIQKLENDRDRLISYTEHSVSYLTERLEAGLVRIEDKVREVRREANASGYVYSAANLAATAAEVLETAARLRSALDTIETLSLIGKED